LYFALVHSHLSYCPIITSCASSKNIQKISRVQKKAIRIISNKGYFEHTDPLFKELKILPYKQLISFSKLNFMHSVTYNYCPSSFTDIWKLNNERNGEPREHNLRNADLLAIPHPRIELYKRSPMYSLPKLWNELDETRNQNCKRTFRASVKDRLLNDQNFLQ
jgi:hypothetical protein